MLQDQHQAEIVPIELATVTTARHNREHPAGQVAWMFTIWAVQFAHPRSEHTPVHATRSLTIWAVQFAHPRSEHKPIHKSAQEVNSHVFMNQTPNPSNTY